MVVVTLRFINTHVRLTQYTLKSVGIEPTPSPIWMDFSIQFADFPAFLVLLYQVRDVLR